jgi:hypothetical protein
MRSKRGHYVDTGEAREGEGAQIVPTCFITFHQNKLDSDLFTGEEHDEFFEHFLLKVVQKIILHDFERFEGFEPLFV